LNFQNILTTNCNLNLNRWVSGDKNLAMHHVFRILLKAAHGASWQEAFQSVVPNRFTGNLEANKQMVNLKPRYKQTEFMAKSSKSL